MSWYRTRVERDLQRWRAAGWLDERGLDAIRADLATRKSAFGVASVFAVLGAILFGFAVLSFVAANWNAMPKLVRLLLLGGTLWTCYAAAGALFIRKLDLFAHAAVLGGVAVYGASIMLIAQMYHMEGNPPDAVLTWALGVLLAAVLARSGPALAAGAVLLVTWSIWERALGSGAHWIFLVPWAVAAGIALWLRWRPGLHLVALSLLTWLIPLGHFMLGGHAHWLVALIGLLVAVACVAAGPAIDRHVPASHAVFTYAVATTFSALYTMQFVDSNFLFGLRAPHAVGQLAIQAILALVLLIGAMAWALMSENRAALWLAYAAFALEIFSLYARMLGTLLNTSLFFLLAALLVSLLAWAAYRLHQRGILGQAA
ncbi:MAG TPA: DUF2157 domain-containing protein [Hyphomicrobiaceae bacterium]|nr:DUF2157 domain-containing protein [Hyphomicrobiaceae bacterium]